ncbi:MAG TPA: outer membrane beta-barrel protein [Polyangia bacterium]|jgi:hypothetical protein
MTRARGGRRAALVAALACGCAAGEARAGGGPATDAYQDVTAGALDVHALADVYVLHDFDRPPSGRTVLREFDLGSDDPSLGYLRLTLARRPSPIGFRIDAGVGDTADVYRSEDPEDALHPQLSRALSYLGQAFVSVVVPLGRGLAVDVGKFATPAGYEDNESIANWNYSRSFLFSWGEPSLHTGVRLSMSPIEKLDLSIFWLDGWNANFVDGDDLRSFALAVGAHPRKSIELTLTYVAGLERAPTALADPTLAWRTLLCAAAEWEARRWLTLVLAADYGDDRARGGVRWGGVAGYVHVQPWRFVSATVRGEYYADPGGFTTGTAQSLGEVTATVELRGRRGPVTLAARLEYRHDQSTARPFVTPAGPVAAQDSMTIALIAAASRSR